MAEYRSHKVRLSNVPKDSALCSIGTKTAGPIIIAWLLALLVLCSQYRYMAIPVAFVALVLTLRHNTRQFRGCRTYFIIYNSQDPSNCDLIYLSEVRGWEYRVKKDGNDYMTVTLQDDEKIRITEGVNIAMYRYFQRNLPQLEIRSRKVKTPAEE